MQERPKSANQKNLNHLKGKLGLINRKGNIFGE